MAEHDLTINQDGVFGQLENLLTEQETQLIEEQDQEIEVEQESDPEQTEEQEEEDQEQEQEQVQEQKQEKEHVDAPVVDKWPGWPGESVYRMLVPSQKVGGIIGRKGEFIKKMCEEAKARIKILDATGTPERAVLVSAKEEPDLSIPPAIDGLLRVHKRIVDGLDESSHAPALGVKVTTRLLVPAVQAGNLIGKQGTTVKSIQEASNCVVRITEDLPSFALQDDRIVEVVGEPTAVHKAVELVACHLRKFLVDRSIIPIFEQQMQTVNPPPQMDHHVPIQQSWGPPQFVQNVPVPNYRATTPTYRAHAQFAPPLQQQHNSYYQPAELAPPLEKQPHQGISAYGREAPLSSNNQPSQSMNTQQVVQQIQIPLLYADAVIGNAGGTISYIRRASGATVTIQETRGVPGEMTVEITGNASQVQTAQQLIQNYMADATAPGTGQAQPAAAAATADQSYNPYATTAAAVAAPPALGGGGGAAYASQTTNPSLGYGSVYGTNYGY